MKKKKHLSPLKIILIAIAAGFLLLTAGCITTALVFWHFADQAGLLVEWEDGCDGTITKDIVYDPGTGHAYDLYLPAGFAAGQKCPVILFIHGGSWTGGRKEDMDYACKYFAKAGCITATMTYSLISEKHPEITLMTVMDEIGSCIGALRQKLGRQ